MTTYGGWPDRERLSKDAKAILDGIGDDRYVLRLGATAAFLVFPPSWGRKPAIRVRLNAARELVVSGLVTKLSCRMLRDRLGRKELGLPRVGDFYACRQ